MPALDVSLTGRLQNDRLSLTHSPNSSTSTFIPIPAEVLPGRLHDDQNSSHDRRQQHHRMDSAIYSQGSIASGSTLFDTPPLLLAFDRKSVNNANLVSRTGPVYCIKTDIHVTRTSLVDLQENKVVAVWKRRDILPDIVYFEHSKKKVRLSKWLRKIPGEKRSHISSGRPSISKCVMELNESQQGCLFWRTQEQYRLALFAEHALNSPVAYHRVLHNPDTISIVIENGLKRATQVEVIMSFLILENRLRMKEKRMELNGRGPFSSRV